MTPSSLGDRLGLGRNLAVSVYHQPGTLQWRTSSAKVIQVANQKRIAVRILSTLCLAQRVHPFHTALSYVWGNPALVRLIRCNSKPFATTENLDLALRQIRRLDVAVLLWVDQICINQDDLQEKNQQVAIMVTIYQRARTGQLRDKQLP